MARKKSKNGKNKSLYGPIKSKPPRPRKASSHQYKRHSQPHHNHNHAFTNKRPNFKRHQSRELRIPVNQVKFTLRLPPASSSRVEYNQVPWFTSNNNTSNTTTSSSISILRHVSNENLKRLDDELLAFSAYVQLTPQEHDARQSLIQHVQETCVNVFGSNNKAISVQPFGSFATPQVCTFQSDVDLILWGVVPVAKHTIFVDEARERSTSMDSDASSIKVDRVQKWKEALAELDAQEKSDDDIVQQQQREKADVKGARRNGDDCSSNGATNTMTEEATMQSAMASAPNSTTNGNQHSVEQDEPTVGGDCLFVIDRCGDSVNEEEKKETDKEAKVSAIASESIATIQQDFPVEDPSSSLPTCASRTTESQSASTIQLLEHVDTNASNQVHADADALQPKVNFDGGLEQARESDSDADSADKLESYRDNRAAIHRQYDHNDSSSSEPDDVPLSANDDSDGDFEVSFVSDQDDRKPAACISSPAGPTGETRKSVVKTLKALARAFWKSSVIHTVEVRRHAKVPIIATGTHLGFEFDVGVGGHNGVDTSQYAATQAQRFESFAPVVMLLKVLLAQQALDKPFTGGLGSYKLYVLVAHHLERHVAMGGADRPSEALATFFFRFRTFCSSQTSQKQHRDTPLETMLSPHRKVECDGGSADLQAIFKLQHCSNLFQQCYSRLLDELEGANYSTDSFLSTIVHPGPLERERDRNRVRAEHVGRYIPSKGLHSTKSRTTATSSQERQYSFTFSAPPGRHQGRQEQNHTKASSRQQAKSSNDRSPKSASRKRERASNGDATSDQLMAGYGLKRGPRGGLIPRNRPDVVARQSSATPEAIGRATKNRKNKKKQKRDEGLKAIALVEAGVVVPPPVQDETRRIARNQEQIRKAAP